MPTAHASLLKTLLSQPNRRVNVYRSSRSPLSTPPLKRFSLGPKPKSAFALPEESAFPLTIEAGSVHSSQLYRIDAGLYRFGLLEI